jgi:hypothetical protein
LPCSVKHVRWNSRDRICDMGLQVIKSVNWAFIATHHSATRWCSTSLGSAGTRIPRQDISREMDWQRQSNALAATFTRRNTVGLCQGQCVLNTS